MPMTDLDLLRMSEEDLVKLAQDLGATVQYVPMINVPSLETVMRGEHPSVHTCQKLVDLRDGISTLITQAEVLGSFDPLTNSFAEAKDN